VERLVAEDVAEDVARDGIDIEDSVIDREAPGRGFLGEMEEGEERIRRLAVDVEIVETALTGGEPIRLERVGALFRE